MCAAPWTLFWPRSGFTPLPGLPMLPVSSARFIERHHAIRALHVLGQPQPVHAERGAVRSHRALRRLANRVRVDAADDAQRVRASRARRTRQFSRGRSTRPCRNPASARSSSTIVCAMALNSATLVPGRTPGVDSRNRRQLDPARIDDDQIGRPTTACLMRAPTIG